MIAVFFVGVIAARVGRQILPRNRVEVLLDRKVNTVIADIRNVRKPRTHLPLNIEAPPHVVRGLRIQRLEGDRLAEVRLQAQRVAGRLRDAVRERIRQRVSAVRSLIGIRLSGCREPCSRFR